jgi:hypothetical protein
MFYLLWSFANRWQQQDSTVSEVTMLGLSDKYLPQKANIGR